jgi:hypothetical protein
MTRRVWTTLLAVVAVVAAGTSAGAQKMTETSRGTGGSPHVKTEWTIDGAALAIEYGRPYLKGRTDAQVMPPGQPWRIGADQPTLLTTDKPLTVGALTIPPGTYTLNTVPNASAWELLVGRYTGASQWGIPYRPDLEIGRAPMTLGRTAAPVDQVTLSIDDTPAGATLRIEWGTASATVPFTVG